MAGELMLALSQAHGGRLLPIDSEHCALAPVPGRPRAGRGEAPASHGLGWPLPQPSPRDLRPTSPGRRPSLIPTWNMGRKISIDSATMMNKGLEVIEARWLFGVEAAAHRRPHPSPVRHPLDGGVRRRHRCSPSSVSPTCASPSSTPCTYPEKWPAAIPGLDLAKAMRLEFHPPDHARFPCLDLAYRALELRRVDTGGPERGQRRGGPRLPRRTHPVHGHPGDHRGGRGGPPDDSGLSSRGRPRGRRLGPGDGGRGPRQPAAGAASTTELLRRVHARESDESRSPCSSSSASSSSSTSSATCSQPRPSGCGSSSSRLASASGSSASSGARPTAESRSSRSAAT